MFRAIQNQEVIVVAIDLNRDDPMFDEYDNLPPEQKLKILTDKINFICQSLQREHKDASWIIVWREYGITGAGSQARAVTDDFKKKFKEALLRLANQYSNLTIIAGTIATEKVGVLDKIRKIQKSYVDLKDIRKLEESTTSQATGGWQIDLHEQALTKLIGELKEDVNFTVVRNTCYVFTRKKTRECEDVAVVVKHHKSAPSNEVSDINEGVHKVFYPGAEQTRTTLVELAGGVKVATEICREHDIGVTKIEMKKNKIPVSDVLIHFVLSDSIKFQPMNAMGEFVVQLDSVSKPRLLVMRDEAGKSSRVSLYQINGLHAENKLVGPLSPVVMFARRILNEFYEVINMTKNQDKKKQLQIIRDAFIESSDSFVSSPMYDCLEKMLQDKSVQVILFAEEKSSFLGSLLFGKSNTQEPDLQAWVQRILSLVAEERTINPFYQEYASKDDSAVNKTTK